MRLRVKHQTSYTYESPIASAIQTLRLTPRSYEALTVLRWDVRGEGRRDLPVFTDGLGNITHCHSVSHPHTGAAVLVEGEVETKNTHGVVRGTAEPLPPLFFLRRTPLTQPDEAIEALAQSVARPGPVLKWLHAWLNTVRDKVDYRVGTTDSASTAAEALAAGSGVCQDHAHLFIAGARLMGIPARYVGGYLWTGEEQREYQASHAWAEAFVGDLGWVGFDASNRICPTEAYIRTSVGLDYWSAAPVRGVRRGLAAETLAVSVRVSQAGAEQ
ncbi:MAG TPA: transglutaminase family protein [Stellaceae bacterium]|nr:transglutaminase family protein [Stellaceae bacterium]